MAATIINRFTSGITPNEHPYLNGAWTPNTVEYLAEDMDVIGTIPADLNGVYIRNTENPLYDAKGIYHPFDGDGMLHTVSFRDGKATYRNSFVRTEGFLAEQEAGRQLWAGTATNPKEAERPGWGARGGMKDASSTDVVVHNGEILSTFYMCGEGYRLDPYTLDDLGTADWVPDEGISAHPKVDVHTGEMMFFNYSKKAPFMHYGVVGRDGRLKHVIPVETPGPRMPHDMAFTENYTILNDLPLFWREDLLDKGIHAIHFHDNLPSRFAIVPRHGSVDDIKWFEASPTYVLHWLNAWEEGDEVIMDGYYEDNPNPGPENFPDIDKRFAHLLANLDEHSFLPKLHRWRFNMRTGKTIEERLDDRILEFGTFNQMHAGRKNRYYYSTTTKPGWFLFTGLVKHDLKTGDSTSYAFGEDRYGSEAPFAYKTDAKAEDDGYIVTFITDMKKNRSECVVLDARNIAAGPVCQIILPHRISSGTHATWASHEEIAGQLL